MAIEVKSDLIETTTVSSLENIKDLFKDYGDVEARASDGKITIFKSGSWLGEAKYRKLEEIDGIGEKMVYAGISFVMGECGWQLEDVRPHEYTKINKHTYPETDFWNVVIPVGSMRDDGSVLFKNLSGNYEWFKVGDSFLLLGSEQYTIKKFEPNKIGDSFLLLGSEQYTIKKFELKQYSKCVMLASVKSGCQCPQCMSKFDEIDKMRMKRI